MIYVLLWAKRPRDGLRVTDAVSTSTASGTRCRLLEVTLDQRVDPVRMGDRPHVPHALDLDFGHARQGLREQTGDRPGRRGGIRADETQGGHVERPEVRQPSRLLERRVPLA